MFDEIKNWLKAQEIEFKTVSHEVTKTSEESAKARGEDLSTGGKALVMKVGKEFKIFVLSASKKADSNLIKKHFGVKKLRFANSDELKELTGLVPGSVPPFGKPIIDMDLCIDQSIVNNSKIAFNAGSLTNSIIMKMEDYRKIIEAEIFEFSQE
jgi:Ala-tRNA(Pro) deacylase